MSVNCVSRFTTMRWELWPMITVWTCVCGRVHLHMFVSFREVIWPTRRARSIRQTCKSSVSFMCWGICVGGVLTWYLYSFVSERDEPRKRQRNRLHSPPQRKWRLKLRNLSRSVDQVIKVWGHVLCINHWKKHSDLYTCVLMWFIRFIK